MTLAVTTRNKLRGRQFFLPMVRGWLVVRRQLWQTPGVARYVTGIASLTEFYTLTIWESRAAMFNFTAGDGHRQMMWNFTRWSESFWAMRWQLTPDQWGAWGNFRQGGDDTEFQPDEAPSGPAWLFRSQLAEALAPYIDVAGRPDKRHLNPTACGVEAILARIETRSLLDVSGVLQSARRWRASPGLLRFALGIGLGECLVVSLWRADGLEVSQAWMHLVRERFPKSWIVRCTAGDYEIGHWGNLRLRQVGPSSNPADFAMSRQPADRA
jgi:hypothetical protein